MALRRGWAAWRWRCAVALALVALLARASLHARLEGAVPRAPPHKLAAHLADFNNLHAHYDHIESWWIEEQWSNYTSWRYTARFSCGARCVGRARVTAHDSYQDEGAGLPRHGAAHDSYQDEGAGLPRHGAAHDSYKDGAGLPRHGATALAHLVLLELSTCRTLPFLPWPSFCDDISVEASVRSDGAAGSRYAEAAVARAPLLSALLGGRGAALRDERHKHWRALQAAFA